MKALVLAAGYATRLYPLTRDRAKPLLEVAGRPIMDYVLDRLGAIEGLDEVFVVTNARFAPQFEQWASARPGVTVLDDGTGSDEDKLGAIGDIAFTLDRAGLDDDLVVVAGDNLFTAEIGDFARVGVERRAPVLAVHDVGDLEAIKRYNALELDGDGRIVFFEEKPQQPRSTIAGIALYFYPRETLPLIHRYVAEGNNADAPGRLVQWLYPQLPVYTWQLPGLWFDIGSHDGLEEADRAFSALSGAP